jgi:hypothetical protein
MRYLARYTWVERFLWPMAGICLCWVVTGCWHRFQEPAAAPVQTAPETLAMGNKIKDLQSELASRNQKIQAMEKEIAGLKMQIISNEALAKDMARWAENQQQRLDAAIVEVVRTKARLRSLESKAEAASTIAEAEIAVNALKKRAPSADEATREEIAAADQLLKMSMEEFQARNFGGALYLASQAKGQVRAVQMQISGGAETATLKGVKPFAQPLLLKLIKNSNLRQGPGLDQKILATLSKGTQVTGYAYKESWVKVKTKDGLTGWLFQSLVDVR